MVGDVEKVQPIDDIVETKTGLQQYEDFATKRDPTDTDGADWTSAEFFVERRDGTLTVRLYPLDRRSDARVCLCIDMQTKQGWLRMIRSTHEGPFQAGQDIGLDCSQARFAGSLCRVRLIADKPESFAVKVSYS